MYLVGMYLVGMHLMGVYLIGIHLVGVDVVDMYLIGVDLIGVMNAKTTMDAKAVITSLQPSHHPITSPWGIRRDYGGAAQLHFPY
jgi:hypothetical protein